jgi:alpha-1,2-mannosyltransferase
VNHLAERESRLLWGGLAVFAAAVAGWVIYWRLGPSYTAVLPVDLTVYRDGGLIARGVAPYYDPHAASPLYDWGGYSDLALKFTYTPFAAVAFALASFLPEGALVAASVVVSIAALVAALWFTVGALGAQAGRGYLDARLASDAQVRAGLTLACAGAALWTQPVLRTLNLGQVNLILMAMIIGDLCQPGETPAGRPRWWKGALTGVAAGIKLVPLVFVPYLLATRRFREAGACVAGFGATVAIGFAILPADSVTWWLHGVFLKGDRTGFTGWAGNQSLRGLITRLAGSIAAGTPYWAVAAAAALVAGIAAAALLYRAGHEVPALLVTALTGLLASPISWDHHWVWVAPGFAAAVAYAARYWRLARRRAWALAGLAAGILVVFGAWPDAMWESARNLGRFSLGLLWAPPNTNPILYVTRGDQPSFTEYHWHGLWLLTGNAYILAGMAVFVVLVASAISVSRRRAAPVSSAVPLLRPRGPRRTVPGRTGHMQVIRPLPRRGCPISGPLGRMSGPLGRMSRPLPGGAVHQPGVQFGGELVDLAGDLRIGLELQLLLGEVVVGLGLLECSTNSIQIANSAMCR